MTDKEKKELEVNRKKEIDASQAEPTREGVTFVPEVDIREDDDGITLLADLPGVRKEDVEIDVREGVLTLTATVEPSPQNRNLIFQEYEIGGFQRRFNLGERIDVEKIGASFDNGVLNLFLPKAAEHKPRKIEIKTS
jgi:HSP20 family protein